MCLWVYISYTYTVIEILYSISHVPINKILCAKLKEYHLLSFENTVARTIYSVYSI